MALSVNEIIRSDVGTSADQQGKISSTAVRTFDIVDDTAGRSAVTVKAEAQSQALIPREFELHPDAPIFYCTKVDVKRESPIYFTCTASYITPKFDPTEDGEEPVDPTALAAQVTWQTVTSEEAIDSDVNGEALKNIGTDEPIMGLTRRIADIQATIVKNFAAFNPVSLLAFIHTVNADTFLGFPPGRGLITDIQAAPQKQETIPYWQVTAQIVFRTPYNTTDDKAWYKRVLHEGFLVLDTGSTNQVTHAIDPVTKERVTQPVLLDETGQQLPTDGTPHWQEFQIYPTTTYADLGFF